MMDELQARRAWFKEYFDSASTMIRNSRPDRYWYTCPVCGYPCHIERGGFDICDLCGWEDDDQDDPHADEIWGGPNGDYSLAEARENFAACRTKYRPGTRGFELDGPGTETNERVRTIVAKFDALRRLDSANWDRRLARSFWREIIDLSHADYGELPPPTDEGTV